MSLAVESLLALAAPITSHASFRNSTTDSHPATFTRRGLQNYQNTCFLNCVMQCLLHCDEFWIYCSRLHALLSKVDPHLERITETTDGLATGQGHHAEQSKQACDFARTIPITHELVAFAAHFRRISRSKKQGPDRKADEPAVIVPPSDPAHEAVVAASLDQNVASAASPTAPGATADAATDAMQFSRAFHPSLSKVMRPPLLQLPPLHPLLLLSPSPPRRRKSPLVTKMMRFWIASSSLQRDQPLQRKVSSIRWRRKRRGKRRIGRRKKRRKRRQRK